MENKHGRQTGDATLSNGRLAEWQAGWMDKKARRTMTEEASNDCDTFIERKVAPSLAVLWGKENAQQLRDTHPLLVLYAASF